MVNRPFKDFADQKNFASSRAAHDWVLVIDADEVLSPELRASLAAWKQRPPEYAVYEITRRTNYLGKWIRHSGWYPEYIPRLYRRDRTRFVGAIHEAIVVNGAAGRLTGDLLHYSIRTLDEGITPNRTRPFTTRIAARRSLRARTAPLASEACGWPRPGHFGSRDSCCNSASLDGYRGALSRLDFGALCLAEVSQAGNPGARGQAGDTRVAAGRRRLTMRVLLVDLDRNWRGGQEPGPAADQGASRARGHSRRGCLSAFREERRWPCVPMRRNRSPFIPFRQNSRRLGTRCGMVRRLLAPERLRDRPCQ